MGGLRFDDAPDVDLIAYTYSFGNGFSATISIEDPLSRRDNNPAVAGFAALRSPTAASGLRTSWRTPATPARGAACSSPARCARSRRRLQLRRRRQPAPAPIYADTDYGFAIALNAYANLPFLGAGDAAWIMGTYTDGAVAYINGGQDGPSYAATIGANPLVRPIADAVVDGLNGDFKTTKAWSVAGGLTHYWVPAWRSSVFGSYAEFDFPGIASGFAPATGTYAGLVDFREYRVGLNTFWLPLPGFQIGVEALYTRVDPKHHVLVPLTNVAGTTLGAAASNGEDIWEGRLRIQRCGHPGSFPGRHGALRVHGESDGSREKRSRDGGRRRDWGAIRDFHRLTF